MNEKIERLEDLSKSFRDAMLEVAAGGADIDFELWDWLHDAGLVDYSPDGEYADTLTERGAALVADYKRRQSTSNEQITNLAELPLRLQAAIQEIDKTGSCEWIGDLEELERLHLAECMYRSGEMFMYLTTAGKAIVAPLHESTKTPASEPANNGAASLKDFAPDYPPDYKPATDIIDYSQPVNEIAKLQAEVARLQAENVTLTARNRKLQDIMRKFSNICQLWFDESADYQHIVQSPFAAWFKQRIDTDNLLSHLYSAWSIIRDIDTQ